MTILFASGEDSGFNSALGSLGLNIITTSGHFRSAYARCAISTTTNGTNSTDPPVNRFQSPVFTATNLLWVHAQFYDLGSSTTLNQQSLIIRSPDGVARIIVRQPTTPYGVLKISSRNAAGTITDLITMAGAGFVTTTLTQFDLKIDYSASGGIQLYMAGALVANYVGDPRTDSATQLNQVEFAHLCNNFTTQWSEIICADTDTRGMALWTLPPVAAGNTQSWTPNTVGNINEVTNLDATFVSTTVNNALSEWTVGGTPPTGTWNVEAVVQEARILCGAIGPQHFDWLVRTGGTDYLASDSRAPLTSMTNFNRRWALNPATSAPWLLTDITASGFNLGIESLA